MPDPRETLADLHGRVMDRRRFLAWSGALAGTAAYAQLRGDLAVAAPPLPGYPFTLGVASGDPAPDTVSLWTRLVPEPFAKSGGMPNKPVAVTWQVADDAGFTQNLRSGTVAAVPELAHSVHADVTGLQPGREYHYRFIAGGVESPTGHTKTAPAYGSHVDSLKFAFASCQAWEDGFYSAYRRMVRNEDLDLVIHLGDYIYEGQVSPDGGRRNVKVSGVLREETRTLESYRLRHTLYKTDPDLQEAHRRFPWAVTWDDHEVENDYAGTTGAYFKPNEGFVNRRAAAYQAYYEHMPLRLSAEPTSTELRLYRSLRYGDIAKFNVMDTRQYRDDQPCGDGEQFACPGNETATKLGAAQLGWLLGEMSGSDARWNVMAQGTMMGQLKHNEEGTYFWQDAWDGYSGERSRILSAIHQMGVSNPVSIAGDWHSTFVHDLKADYADATAPVVATEFVGTSITSNGDGLVYGPYYAPMVPFNDHIKFFDGDRRGYVLCTLDHEVWQTELRMVENVASPDAAEYTFASFVVENGQPGAQINCSPGSNPPPLGRVDCTPV